MSRIVDSPSGLEVSHRDLILIYDRDDDSVIFNDGLLLGVKYDSIPRLQELLAELVDRVESQRGLDAKLKEIRSGAHSGKD